MQPPTRATSPRHILAAIGACALGFVAVAGLLHLLIGDGLALHADIRSEKLLLMQQWRGQAYSASFGSSHVHNGFDPRAFDRALAGTPAETRTVNLAIAGGSQTEQRTEALEYLRHFQAPAPPQACMVLLELNAGANFTNEHLVHPRAINIYDWPTTRFVWQLTSPDMGLRQRGGRMGYAIAAMGLHYLNVGMVSSAIFAPSLNREMLATETANDRRGLYVIADTPRVRSEIKAIIAARPESPTPAPLPLLPGNRSLVDELQKARPVKNLSMVYIVMPKLEDLTSYPVTPDSITTSAGQVPIVNLARPDRYPDIYQQQYWQDSTHLNEDGAALASTYLATALKSWYALHGWPARCGG